MQIDSDPLLKKLRPYFHFKRAHRLACWRAKQIINQRDSGSVAEVGYFLPKDLKRFLKEGRRDMVVYVGCPTIDIEKKLALLIAGGFKNTEKIKNLNDADRRDWLTTLRERSILHQSQCAELGIPFFDFSDTETLDAKQQEAADWIKTQLRLTPS